MDRFQAVKERVKDASDLVALVESYLPLRAAGRNLVALCPFHQEKTPSFTVYPDSQHFKCYGCGKSGDVFSFVMEREGVDFRASMEILAQRAGIPLDGAFGRPEGRGAPRADAFDVLAEVRDWFHAALGGPDGARARTYLQSRGLDGGAEPFGLGAHPSRPGALLEFARRKKLPADVLAQAGLVKPGGGEPFRGRLMFPIEDERGRVVGFGGRLLEDGRAKYINSPESPIFHKRKVLYGLRRAKQSGERRIVVMEGYTDVIACHLAGFAGAVATLGTAFTPDHGGVLLRYAKDGVVLLFDGDAAGRSAAEKAFAELARTDLAVRTVILPDGADPADLMSEVPGRSAEERERGRREFGALLDGAADALSTWFRLKRARLDLTQEANVMQVVDDCAAVLAGVDDPARRELLAQSMARQLGVSDRSFRESVRRRSRRPARQEEREGDASPGGTVAGPAAADTALSRSDAEVLACVLARPGLAETALAGLSAPGRLEPVLRAAAELAAGTPDGGELLRALFTRFGQEADVAALLASASDLRPSIRDGEATLATLLRHRRAYHARLAAQKTRLELQQARSAGDRELEEELTRRYLAELREQQFG